jgi:hypothetical protein
MRLAKDARMGFLARIVISAHFRSTVSTASIMSPSMSERTDVVENRREIFCNRAWRLLQFVPTYPAVPCTDAAYSRSPTQRFEEYSVHGVKTTSDRQRMNS